MFSDSGITKQMREEKKLLEQQIDNMCSLIEQVMEDKGKMMEAAEKVKIKQNVQNFQTFKDEEVIQELYNVVEQVKNIISESEKTEKILKDLDYELENETKLKLKLIRNFFLDNTIIFFILNI